MKEKLGLVQLSENDLKEIKAGAVGIPCNWFCAYLCDSSLICRLTSSACSELSGGQTLSKGSCPHK